MLDSVQFMALSLNKFNTEVATYLLKNNVLEPIVCMHREPLSQNLNIE
jgi:hypothetical protein